MTERDLPRIYRISLLIHRPCYSLHERVCMPAHSLDYFVRKPWCKMHAYRAIGVIFPWYQIVQLCVCECAWESLLCHAADIISFLQVCKLIPRSRNSEIFSLVASVRSVVPPVSMLVANSRMFCTRKSAFSNVFEFRAWKQTHQDTTKISLLCTRVHLILFYQSAYKLRILSLVCNSLCPAGSGVWSRWFRRCTVALVRRLRHSLWMISIFLPLSLPRAQACVRDSGACVHLPFFTSLLINSHSVTFVQLSFIQAWWFRCCAVALFHRPTRVWRSLRSYM